MNSSNDIQSSPFVDKPERSEGDNYSDEDEDKYSGLDKDELLSKVQELEYQLKIQQDDWQREKLGYEQSIRGYEQKVKNTGKRADDLELNQEFLYNQQRDTMSELEEIKEGYRIERAELEQQIKKSKEELSRLKDENEDTQNQARSRESFLQREVSELKNHATWLETQVSDLQSEMENTVLTIESKQNELYAKEEEINKLSEKLISNESSKDDQERIQVAERDLSQQIEYTHQLEQKVADQKNKISKLEESDQLLQIVQEAKESLESKLESMEELRQRAVDSETMVSQLTKEKTKWTSYLEKDDNFNTPEDVVRALMRERVEKIGLLDRLGKCEAELAAKDVNVVEDLTAKEDLDDMKEKYEKEANHRARLQRQKELTAKECAFLREQMKSYDAEESSMHKDYNEGLNQRIAELQKLLDESRKEQDKLAKEIAENDGAVVSSDTPKRKKPRQSDIMHDERLSEALRRVRNLQTELEESKTATRQYEQELTAVNSQLETYQESSSTQKERVLELRNNPTAKYEKIKTKAIEALRAENEDLIKELNNSQSTKMVPMTVVDRVRDEVSQLEKSVAEQKKSKERLSKVYQKLSTDLRQTVFALMGYQVDPQPNKKVRVKSIFSTDEDEALTFVPDPNSKTPKYVGIDDSSILTKEYENLVTFWVKERKDIPCFLAALTLELYDKTTKASRF